MATRPFPIDFETVEPDSKPRCCLALAKDHPRADAADLESPVFACAPDEALDAFIAAGLSEARVTVVRRDAQTGQVELVQRSLLFRFPDYVTVEPVDLGAGHASLNIYSRAVLGYSDLGVNEKRVRRWLEAAAERLDQAAGNAK